MKKSEQISNIAAALAMFQRDIKNPNNTADNKFFSSKYAPLPDIINHVKQKLSEYQLAVFQSVGGDGENVSVTTLLVHSSGEWIESDPLIIKNQEQKGVSLAQAAGISITYARRYSLSAALGISSEDDTDGNTGEQQKCNPPNQKESHIPTDPNKCTKEQIAEIFKLANEKKADDPDFDIFKHLEQMESEQRISTKYPYADKSKTKINWTIADYQAIKDDLELPF